MENSKVLSKEIEQLESRLATKKQELVGGNNVPEKMVLKTVIEEHGESAGPTESGGGGMVVNPVTQTAAPNRPISDAEKKIVSDLVLHAFDHGLKSALKKARQTGDAFFIDYLHDQLADEYYEKMLTARRINPS